MPKFSLTTSSWCARFEPAIAKPSVGSESEHTVITGTWILEIQIPILTTSKAQERIFFLSQIQVPVTGIDSWPHSKNKNCSEKCTSLLLYSTFKHYLWVWELDANLRVYHKSFENQNRWCLEEQHYHDYDKLRYIWKVMNTHNHIGEIGNNSKGNIQGVQGR